MHHDKYLKCKERNGGALDFYQMISATFRFFLVTILILISSNASYATATHVDFNAVAIPLVFNIENVTYNEKFILKYKDLYRW